MAALGNRAADDAPIPPASPVSLTPTEPDSDTDSSVTLPRTKRAKTAARTSCRLPGTRWKSGSIEYLQTAVAWPPGPQTPYDFSQWPKDVVRRLFSYSEEGFIRARRFEDLQRNGHMLHTDFSGQGCVEQAYDMMSVACDGAVALPKPWVTSHRSCDNDRTCQSILVHRGAKHVFGDVLLRLPPAVRDAVHALRPGPNPKIADPAASATEWKSHAAQQYKRMRAMLSGHASSCFGPGMPSEGCLQHPGEQRCVLAYSPPDGMDPSMVPLSTCVAGSMCTPWSSFGSRDGPAHPSSESHSVWVEDMLQSDFDMVTLENSEYFPLKTWKNKMCKRFLVVHICVCPNMLGWPARRMRMYATAINLDKLVWVGPSAFDAQQVADDFLKMFGARVCVEADLFANLDSPENRQKYRMNLANMRGIFSGDHSTLDLLPPDAQRRLHGYMDMLPSSRGLGGCCVADLSQNPSKRARIGPWFGACTRSSMFCSLTAAKHEQGPYMFTPAEISFANGWPSVAVHGPDGTASVFEKTLPGCMKALTARQASLLCGNGMHLHTLAAWLMYVQCHCVRRERLMKWSPVSEAQIGGDGRCSPSILKVMEADNNQEESPAGTAGPTAAAAAAAAADADGVGATGPTVPAEATEIEAFISAVRVEGPEARDAREEVAAAAAGSSREPGTDELQENLLARFNAVQ